MSNPARYAFTVRIRTSGRIDVSKAVEVPYLPSSPVLRDKELAFYLVRDRMPEDVLCQAVLYQEKDSDSFAVIKEDKGFNLFDFVDPDSFRPANWKNILWRSKFDHPRGERNEGWDFHTSMRGRRPTWSRINPNVDILFNKGVYTVSGLTDGQAQTDDGRHHPADLMRFVDEGTPLPDLPPD